MRRPLAFGFLFFSAGIWTGVFVMPPSGPAGLAAGGLGVLAGLAAGEGSVLAGPSGLEHIGKRPQPDYRRQLSALLAVFCVGFLCLNIAHQRFLFPAEAEAARVTVKGTVIGVSVKEHSGWLTVRGTWQVEESRPDRAPDEALEPTAGRASTEIILLKVSGPVGAVAAGSFQPFTGLRDSAGREICFCGSGERPSGPRNPGGFHYARYLKSRQIRLIVSGVTSDLSLTGPGFAPAVRLAALRAAFADRLCRQTGPAVGGMVYAMLFGDKDLLSDDLYDLFRKNGTAHILAVSGIHVGIVYLCLCRLLAGRALRLRLLLIMSLLLLYAWLCAFSPSVMRALLMIGTHMMATLCHRRYDLLSGLSLAGLLILLYNPYYLFHPGFQLSFLAVLTLAFGLPYAESRLIARFELKRAGAPAGALSRTGRLLRPVLPLFVIQLGMLPATAYQFCYISLSAFWVNLPVVALAGWLIPLGFGLFLLGGVGGPAAELAAIAVAWPARLMIWLNEWAAGGRFSAINVTAPPAAGLVLFYSAWFGLLSEAFWRRARERRRRFLAGGAIACLAISGLVFVIVDQAGPRPDLVFVDVGQGDCLHIRMPDGRNVLIDGGGSRHYDVGRRVLLPYLLKNGVAKIDLAIATHLHEDHFGGLVSLCREIPMERLAVFSGNQPQEAQILAQTGLARAQLLYLARGDRLDFGKQGRIEVLFPEKGPTDSAGDPEKDENSFCLILRVSIRGVTTLITGDVGLPGEANLLAGGGSVAATILKVGHHGSHYSTGDPFLEAVNPRLAVISVGRNNRFGHPHAKVIEKLAANDIMTVRTDRSGAVLLTISRTGRRFTLKTMRPLEDSP